MRRPRPERGGLRHLAAFPIAVLFLLPLYFMASGSLRKAGEPPPADARAASLAARLGNYDATFDLVDIPRYTLNSLIVAAFAVPLTVLTASWAGFAMGRLSQRWAGAQRLRVPAVRLRRRRDVVDVPDHGGDRLHPVPDREALAPLPRRLSQILVARRVHVGRGGDLHPTPSHLSR